MQPRTNGIAGVGSTVHSEETAREKAYKTAFEAVSGMNIGEDGFIREDDLVELSGVSRTPVREALQRLQAEGMIRLVPRKGAYVAAITPYEIRDLLQTRNLFECFAAELVIREAQNDTLDQLQRLLEEQTNGLKEGAPQARLIELDRVWHATLVAGSRNKLISEMYQSLKNREVRLMLTVLSGSGRTRWQQAIDEHAQILAALRAGDANAARVAIRHHCEQTGKAALGDLGSFT